MILYDIAAIKEKINCIDYAQRIGLSISRSGGRCVSPLRAGAKNPTSFIVKEDFFFDFGAGRGGDVIDFCAEYAHDGDKGAAIKELAAITGVHGEHTDGWMAYTNNMNARAAHYHAALTDSDREYLRGRGLTDGDIDRLMIGRVTDTELKGRLFLPYFFNGYVCYYATRAMPGGAYPERKYMKQQIDEHCQHLPWGLHTLDRGGDTLVIAEGYFDATAFAASGYPVLSAITGFFSGSQLPMVLSAARQFKRVFFVYDNDKISHAGEKFAEKMARILLKERIDFIVGRVPEEYKDVSEYYEAGEVLQSLVNNAINGLTYLCEKYDDVNELAQFLRPIALYQSVGAAENAIEQLKERGGRFSASEWGRLHKKVMSAPSEKEVRDKVVSQHDLLYVEEVGFYEWDDHIWKRIPDSVVRGYCDAVLGNFLTDSRSRSSCNLIRTHVAMNEFSFDKQPVLTFPNGTLELETGVFRASRKEDYCSIIMDYDYDPEASCPTWDQFIHDVTHGDGIREENLQFIPGYALMPHCNHQKIFVLLGKGGNGKSVYLELIQRLLGNRNVTHVEPTGLAQEFQRVLIKDSLLNIGSDINSDFSKGEVREWLLKIADGTTVQACYKGKTHINFEPRCKLVYACNTVPVAEVVNGLERRFLFIDFPCKFVETPDKNDPLQKKRDIGIISKLEKELSGIFNWAYRGYKLLSKVGYFTETLEHEGILDQFRTISNPVEEFCNDRAFAGEMTRDEIYTWYRDWCDDAGHKPLSRTKFVPKFREIMEKQIKEEKQVRKNGVRARMFRFS